MPNTPALVGEGMTLMCYDENILSGEEFSKVKKYLNVLERWKF